MTGEIQDGTHIALYMELGANDNITPPCWYTNLYS